MPLVPRTQNRLSSDRRLACRFRRRTVPGSKWHSAVVDHPRQGGHAHRHARFQGRHAEQGHARQGLRRSGCLACAPCVCRHLAGRQHSCRAQGPAKRWREGQRSDGLVGADGRQVAVPDGQCRHHLHRRRPRPDEGADGHRGASAGAGHGAGRLVPLGHRRRHARTGPRRRRQVPDRAAGLQGSSAARRIQRRARQDQLRSVVRACVHREQQRPQTGGRAHQEVHQGLSVQPRRRRHTHRRVPGGQGPAGRDRATAADGVP